MLHIKNWKRRLVCFLFACATLVTVVMPAFAVPTAPLQIPSTQLPLTEALKPEVSRPISGHQVSEVHRYASLSSVVIGCLENGVKLNVLGSTGNFYRIDCYDMTGYIAKSQVRTDSSGQYYVNCQKNSSETKYLASQNIQQALTARSTVKAQATRYIGVPYVWGGSTPRGFDCSGFTQYVLRKAGLSINRTCVNQLENGIIIAKKDLQCGDFVFFSNTTGPGKFASHVGIYLGEGKLIHAGSSKGVTIVDLDSSYFASHYQCSRRMILSDLAPTVTQPVSGLLPKTAGITPWKDALSSANKDN